MVGVDVDRSLIEVLRLAIAVNVNRRSDYNAAMKKGERRLGIR